MCFKRLFGSSTNLILFCMVFLNIGSSVLASLSGLYIDNGIDQTVMHHALDDGDMKEVEHEILEMLGLPDRPRRRHRHPSLKKSAPKFLLDVYERLNQQNDDGTISRVTRSTTDTDNLITELDKMAIDQSDIIMTFLNKNHHVSEVRHERGRRLWFDVSEVPQDISLMMAELRIYQDPLIGRAWDNEKNFVITVYAITNADGQKELEILSYANTTSNYHGWLELNVTEGLSKWIEQSKENKGLYIGVHMPERPEREIKLEDVGLVSTKGDDQYQPFMVGFFKGQEIIKPVKHSRTKRNTQRRPKKSAKRNLLTEARPPENPRSCQIQTLFVHFKDLKWQDWIIAPDGYGAFYCSGECNFPLNAHMNATNHAIVQTLVHLMQPTKVPKPCCAPTTLSPISVLYYLNEQNVTLKKYKNMVVKSCGCH